MTVICQSKTKFFFYRDSEKQRCGRGNNFYLIWFKQNRKQVNVLCTLLIMVISDMASKKFYKEAVANVWTSFH